MAVARTVDVQRRLLGWFDANRRDLPWRRSRDPYRILIAEYILQRTRVVSGIPYYERFLDRFPDVESLARASVEEVLRVWEGLGFYRRARNLHAAARAIVEEHGGRIPTDADTLSELPGIGPYTAGAVASIAFGQRVPAVDGNAVRVLCRIYRVEGDITRGETRRRLDQLARSLVPRTRPGEFNQALMELGATVCLPVSPLCRGCPISGLCLAYRAGTQGSLPRKGVPRRPREVRVAFALVRSKDRVLLVRRPSNGLLAGLWSLPGGELREADERDALRNIVHGQTGLRIRLGKRLAHLDHRFSHRRWTGTVYAARAEGSRLAPGARWVGPAEISGIPVATFTRRALSPVKP